MFGASIDNNPAPGNKLGGLTTIYEKSLGAIAKAGNTPLNQVVGYAERVTERGFVHMDTPGYDVSSITGFVAGGCQVIVFTTGMGTPVGTAVTPVIKVISNTPAYQKMKDNIDINAGAILEGKATLEEVGERIYNMILQVAGGQKTKAEILGENQFTVWRTTTVL